MDLPYHTPLNADQQTAAGLTDPQPFAIMDRVRFGEIDVLGHVNNIHYLQWFETLRVRYFVDRGMTTYTRPATEPRIVIRRGETDYLAELRLGADYVATCRCTRFRRSSFTLSQQLWSDGRLSATMTAIIVLLTPDGSGRQPIPDAVQRRFLEIDKAERDVSPPA